MARTRASNRFNRFIAKRRRINLRGFLSQVEQEKEFNWISSSNDECQKLRLRALAKDMREEVFDEAEGLPHLSDS